MGRESYTRQQNIRASSQLEECLGGLTLDGLGIVPGEKLGPLRSRRKSTSGSFQLGCDEELLRGIVVFDSEYVRFAADLAVFDVGLAASGGLVNAGDVPFSARSALEAGFHFFEDNPEFTTAEVESV